MRFIETPQRPSLGSSRDESPEDYPEPEPPQYEVIVRFDGKLKARCSTGSAREGRG